MPSVHIGQHLARVHDARRVQRRLDRRHHTNRRAVLGAHQRALAYTDAMLGLDLDQLRDRREIEEALTGAAPDPRVRGFLMQSLRRRHDTNGYEWRPNLELLGSSLDVIGDWPSTANLAPFEGPVLWIAGAESDYVKPDHMAAMRELFPKVRLVTVKNAGHWVHADRPEVVVELLQYLAGLPLS